MAPVDQAPGPEERPDLDRLPKTLKKKQLELEYILRSSSDKGTDWPKALSLMYYDDRLNPNTVDQDTRVGTLHRAAFDGQAEILRWCLRFPVDVDTQTVIGRTALHYACDGNQPASVRALLELKANPNQGALSGVTPLHCCCINDCCDAAEVLLQESETVIDLDAEDTRRRTAEMITQNPKMLRHIRDYHASSDEKRKFMVQMQAALAFAEATKKGPNLAIVFRGWVQQVQPSMPMTMTKAPEEDEDEEEDEQAEEAQQEKPSKYIPPYVLAMQGIGAS
eukprot:TRINITY_DN10956_c0_g1_i1.p1 TRINITY_DN10956_c0_g1~~TRINITY_DN10956_c0_g1_i1.p1  ORF type:complete len:279 (+),score=60.13 TRINITY_DN10956_c0_g1_i1:418-1254(+)